MPFSIRKRILNSILRFNPDCRSFLVACSVRNGPIGLYVVEQLARCPVGRGRGGGGGMVLFGWQPLITRCWRQGGGGGGTAKKGIITPLPLPPPPPPHHTYKLQRPAWHRLSEADCLRVSSPRQWPPKATFGFLPSSGWRNWNPREISTTAREDKSVCITRERFHSSSSSGLRSKAMEAAAAVRKPTLAQTATIRDGVPDRGQGTRAQARAASDKKKVRNPNAQHDHIMSQYAAVSRGSSLWPRRTEKRSGCRGRGGGGGATRKNYSGARKKSLKYSWRGDAGAHHLP